MRLSRGALRSLLLSLLGLGLAGYLYYLHLGLLRGEFLGGAACGSGPFNCHAVTAGSWGAFAGIPLALWGVLGYLAVLALALLAFQSADMAVPALTGIALLATLFVAADLVLFSVMVFVIRYYCLFCLLTYLVNLSLLVVSVRALERPWWPAVLGQSGTALAAFMPSPARPATGLFWGLLLVSAAGIAGLHATTTYLAQGPIGNLRQQLREFVTKQPRASVEVSGSPVQGRPDAPIQVVEFSDFFCPACQKASKFNTIILANHRQDAAFVFKLFPLDMACNTTIQHAVHPGACAVAAAAACVHQQGKFWAFHDLVFEQGHDYKMAGLEADVARLGADVPRFQACMASGQGMERVKRDVAEGGRLGVNSTPTYVVNGVRFTGGFSPSVFDEIVAVLREQSGQ